MSECQHPRSQGFSDEDGRSRCGACGDVWQDHLYGPNQGGFTSMRAAVDAVTDELHARAVEAAARAAWLSTGYLSAQDAIDTYLAFHRDHGDPLVRVSEVVWHLRYIDWQEDTAADAIEARFAPGPEDGGR